MNRDKIKKEIQKETKFLESDKTNKISQFKRYTFKKKILFAFLLALFILILSAASIEVFSILLIKKMGYNWEPAYLKIIKGYKSSNLYGGRTEYHPWGQWNVPNYEGRITNNCIDVKYSFNSYGARDKERNLTGEKRTLVFGDSFIEGWGVAQDKTITDYLEKESGKEFLNFGIAAGFSVLNDYILYRDFANKFEHDSLMVAITIGNDFNDIDPKSWQGLAELYYRPFFELSEDKKQMKIVYYAPRVEGKFVPGLEPRDNISQSENYDNLADFSAFLRLPSFIKDHKVYFSKDSNLAKKSNYDLNFSEDAITATVLSFDKFAKLAEGKKRYVAILPSAADVYHYLNNGKQKYPKFEEFKKKLENQGWQVIDALKAFDMASTDQVPQYYICDGHYSAKGNELAADYIYESIK